ncbi:hypothetical protein K438DRAFT_1752245 [Mycena galopus ATCC 62051]|nr:hypothetical protein K438DRAFT_1752245 [Mycena galopus ATCC 62051]
MKGFGERAESNGGLDARCKDENGIGTLIEMARRDGRGDQGMNDLGRTIHRAREEIWRQRAQIRGRNSRHRGRGRSGRKRVADAEPVEEACVDVADPMHTTIAYKRLNDKDGGAQDQRWREIFDHKRDIVARIETKTSRNQGTVVKTIILCDWNRLVTSLPTKGKNCGEHFAVGTKSTIFARRRQTGYESTTGTP